MRRYRTLLCIRLTRRAERQLNARTQPALRIAVIPSCMTQVATSLFMRSIAWTRQMPPKDADTLLNQWLLLALWRSVEINASSASDRVGEHPKRASRFLPSVYSPKSYEPVEFNRIKGCFFARIIRVLPA